MRKYHINQSTFIHAHIQRMVRQLHEGKGIDKAKALSFVAYQFHLNRSPFLRRSNEEIRKDAERDGAYPTYLTAPARAKRIKGKRKRAL